MISIFTPCHDISWLERTHNSVINQVYKDWEWIILCNGKAKNQFLSFQDPRIKIFRCDFTENVGALKRKAIEFCSGEWVVELDHDDELLPDCLEEISNSDADFCYSNCAVCKDEQNTNQPFHADWGWEYNQINWKGLTLPEIIAPEFHPANWSLIYYAPDHVRAFNRKFYWKIGGHNPALAVGDDHDLIIRLYLSGGKISKINKCLYVYHIHGKNTWLKRNQEIQDSQWNNHYRYLYSLSEKWAETNGYLKIDLGGGIDKAPGYTSYDFHNGEILGDLNETWKLKDNSVGVIRAHDILEHLKDPIHTMNEAYRVLVPGGLFLISVPDARGQGGYCDPTHCSFWVPRSFRYYTEQNMQRYIPGSKCKFQQISLREISKWDDNVPYIECNLVAYKEKRYHGAFHWT